MAARLALLRDEAAFAALFRALASAVDRKGRDFRTVAPATEFGALGLDSFTMMEILGRLEERFDVTLMDHKVAGLRTVGDLAAALEAELLERTEE